MSRVDNAVLYSIWIKCVTSHPFGRPNKGTETGPSNQPSRVAAHPNRAICRKTPPALTSVNPSKRREMAILLRRQTAPQCRDGRFVRQEIRARADGAATGTRNDQDIAGAAQVRKQRDGAVSLARITRSGGLIPLIGIPTIDGEIGARTGVENPAQTQLGLERFHPGVGAAVTHQDGVIGFQFSKRIVARKSQECKALSDVPNVAQLPQKDGGR